MEDKIYSINEITEIVLPIIQRYNAQKAVLFGSYARNEADGNSDIDVMVIGGRLFEPTDIFCIADDLYKVVKKPVDVYEESEIDSNSDFYKSILSEGVVLR